MLTTGTSDTRLDLPASRGQRQATFRFDLVDGATDQKLRTLQPLRDQPPTLTHDTSRSIKRTVDQIAFNETDTAAIDPLAHRIRIYMLIGGTAWPLGRYMFSSQLAYANTGGIQTNDALVDEMFLVDQQLTSGFSGSAGVTAAVQDLLAGLPLPGVQLEASPYPAVGAWTVGTRRGQILDALATQGDYLPAWLDHNGIFRMVRTIDPADAIPTFDLDANDRVIAGTISRTSDVLNAPNRFVVVSNGGDAADTGFVGTYDVPPTAPHSITNRGFVVADVRTLQVGSFSQATAAARNIGLRQTIYERTDLSTPPDPRHDSYDVIRWQATNWLEIAWSMPLIEGGQMRHTMRKAYT